MAYATAARAAHDGAIIYGNGGFEVRQSEGGFIYFPTASTASRIRAMGDAPVAMDSATPAVGSVEWFRDATEEEVAGLAKRRCKPAAKADDGLSADDRAELVATLLLPSVLRIIEAEDRAAARAKDDSRSEHSEQVDLYGEPDAKDGEEVPIESRVANWYRQARDYWKGVSTKTRQGSQFAGMTGRVASPTAVKTKAATATDGKAEDPVAANARKARQHSAFARF
jgi:hypothetical protein